MNQTEYKNMKALMKRLEDEEYSRNWQHIYNIISWTLPHNTRYAMTEAGKKRCTEAAERFAKLRDKMLAGWNQDKQEIVSITTGEATLCSDDVVEAVLSRLAEVQA